LLTLSSLALQGCFTVRYIAQAAGGEYHILHAARPIASVIADDTTPERIRRLVGMVRAMKAYGQTQGLRPTRNYDSYADLHRAAAVWVVEACAPLAFQSVHWSFPFIGSIPYLGFFHEGDARKLGASLERQGLDVEVRTAAAFSTLGWFKDPVLSTMIPAGSEALGELADTVLHESVHATLYVKDQSAFNESLASFVAERLTGPFLSEMVGPEAPETRAWAAAQARYTQRLTRLHRAYEELDAVYRSDRSDAAKRVEKAALLGALRAELGVTGVLNNATLAGYRTYDTGGPAFERLLTACRGSFPRMLKTLSGLRAADFGQAQREDFGDVIDRLTARGCEEMTERGRDRLTRE